MNDQLLLLLVSVSPKKQSKSPAKKKTFFSEVGVMSLAFQDRRLLVPPMVHLEGQGCGAEGGGGAEMRLQDSLCLGSSTISDSNSPAKLLFDLRQGEALQGEIEGLIAKGVVERAPLSPGYYSRLFCSAEGFRCMEASNRSVGSQEVRQADEVQNGI